MNPAPTHVEPQGPPGDTRERLLRAALFAFAEKGFEGAGIREIASRAQANSAMVQYHFGGKEGLYMDVLRWMHDAVFSHAPLPDVTSVLPMTPDSARANVVTYVRMFMRDLRACHMQSPVDGDPALWQAALTLWHREMHHPRPSVAAFILDTIRPYIQFLEECIKTLRPDLDDEGINNMGICLQGPLLFLHEHIELLGLIRGKPISETDLEALETHIIDFSLRGLGIPETASGQGA